MVRRRLVRRRVPARGVRMAPPPAWPQLQSVRVELGLGGNTQTFLILPGTTAYASIDALVEAVLILGAHHHVRLPLTIRAAVV